ncbi:MAG: glycoside hydrolase family 15 protein [Nanoarchaeota archaeon]|nr:glycoside hydrolase family 15 protein [Nanoarchaeota archaeon]
MTRHIILGNGNMLVCTDKNALIRDFYYPYVGQENHVSGNVHRIGIWVDGYFSWLTSEEWGIDIRYRKDSLVSEVRAVNGKLGIELLMTECVHFDRNVYMRNLKVKNISDKEREVRVFFSQHFRISEDDIGDSIFFDPKINSIVNYKGKRYFLIGGQSDGVDFVDYATGVSGGIGNRQGTYVDCEDGVLSKNSVEHGSTDSAIGFSLRISAGGEKGINYWISVGKKYSEVLKIRNFVLKNGFEKLMEETSAYWVEWGSKRNINFHELDEKIVDLFKRSLLIIRAQTDNHGATIAANDTHTLRTKRDTYSYMWPRDGALISRSLDRAGHGDLTKKFFKFCSEVVSEDGYLMHKYNPDGSLGSSWHSWLKGDKIQLPIQEDETALVMYALWKHYEKYGDEDGIIKKMYRNFIKNMGDFLAAFRNLDNGLPKESYDLWEEKLGVHTFTCSTVYAGLVAASKFAEVFGNKKDMKRYEKVAEEVRVATLKYMFDESRGVFIKGIYYDKDDNMQMDGTIDASTFYGLFEFGVIDVNDEKLSRTVELTLEKLWFNDECSGLARYENDMYHRVHWQRENSWIVSTMWLAEYYINKAKSVEDLKLAKNLLDWAVKRALLSGVLSEQLNPLNSHPLSVAPLTWSHAGFAVAVMKYLGKIEKIEKGEV